MSRLSLLAPALHLVNPAELFRQETDALQLAPGDSLFREGEKGEKMYVLLEGEMEILLGDFVLETTGKAR